MKKLILLLMIILSTLSFAAKKLYVGTNAEFKPYEYLEGDKITGFDIDFMNAIGKEIGYEVQWVNMGFDGLLPALQMNKVDAVIAGMSQTPERQKAVDFSMPYMFTKSEHYVIVNENSPIVKKEELKDKKVGVQIGTIQEEFTIALGGIPQIYNAWTGALMDLQQDKISAVIIADVSGNAYLANMKGLKKVDVVIDNQPGASIAFRKGETELVKSVNEAILKLRDDGTYLQLLEKYFPERAEDFKKAFKK
ncbi:MULTISPECIES: basic amino acid ABC transporter substrate-binding protein [Fusobacterium]|jgi:polar amino acid transport system substrate-binding protein|uniref:Basic amino acid ABC transporter substrate-binding protein n=1 Tax=Fusobacterium varium ATCC 27725 TaxID=469618 RepID=A0ABN5JKP4_FUSVA|nr:MULTISPECIES: basic amino acid ABC transporter substrate-binding protein [Fusobacterium]AVQ31172.1 basic amino acid ABC transporter substrate-binding protein [Fusobacterium varium ATCC 27725]EES62486.1 putative glutamine ABC transporter, periplasmic glutamine-binding protein GlnH [Fusobacterium varium ATCC 27725]MCF0171314.1 basic amino acid ABC transporter substrate-binding protein [Fusobacterium varium]MDY4004607.1 basic amino acid ABC transporter substrate-binding protein [Fusobacterium v